MERWPAVVLAVCALSAGSVHVGAETDGGADHRAAMVAPAAPVAETGMQLPPHVDDGRRAALLEGMKPRSRPKTRWADRLGAKLAEELECLALNIYWEARSEPPQGQLAVATVTLNRVAHPAFPDSVCEVVRQGGDERRYACQFSWWCDGKTDAPDDHAAWAVARAIARKAVFLDPPDPTRGALWYHADYARPFWAEEMTRITKIGRHIYYRDSRTDSELADARS